MRTAPSTRSFGFFSFWLPMLLLVLGCAPQCYAAELKAGTAAAFDKYVQTAEARMAGEVRPGGPFLYIDSLSSQQRALAYQQLARGEIYVAQLQATANGKKIDIPDGMVHHWVGIMFVPNTDFNRALPVVRDYSNRTEVYKPDVIASKLISHQGDDYKIFLRFIQKKFTTVVLNTEFDVDWYQRDPTHLYSNSYSTRIAEVRNPSQPDGPELPVGKDRGYLWRLYTYWRYVEQDGGVYIQCEAISLTRDIPFGMGWLLRPLVTSIPRQSLNRTLGQTRAAILQKQPNK
jgi:hypothetical protein